MYDRGMPRSLTPKFLAALGQLLEAEGLLPVTRLVEFLPSTPLAEQVQTFATARLIVANHGAGCTNVVFAPSEAIFVELEPILFPCYRNVAERLGLHHIQGSQQPEHRSRLFRQIQKTLMEQQRRILATK